MRTKPLQIRLYRITLLEGRCWRVLGVVSCLWLLQRQEAEGKAEELQQVSPYDKIMKSEGMVEGFHPHFPLPFMIVLKSEEHFSTPYPFGIGLQPTFYLSIP